VPEGFGTAIKTGQTHGKWLKAAVGAYKAVNGIP